MTGDERNWLAERFEEHRGRRVKGATTAPDADLACQRQLVDAFLAASRGGDFDALVAVLDADVVFRVDREPAPVRGAAEVARRVLERGRPLAPLGRPALVNGSAGVLVGEPDRPLAVVAFTVARGRIASIDVITDVRRARILNGA